MALLIGASLAPMGVHALYDGKLLPILMWLVAVAASWGAVHVFVARPLLTLEAMATAHASGDGRAIVPLAGGNMPAEIASLQRSLLSMTEAIRGREALVAEAVVEQRALLREVNHRVMNNLQVVLSILSIQARDADSATQKAALARAHRRVQLLALTQGQIYAAGEVNHVRLDYIVAEIARAVIDTRGVQMAAVSLSLALEAVRMTTDRAASVGFLIAESLSLLLSRIPAGQPAKVFLSLRNTSEQEIEFTISAPEAFRVMDESKMDARLVSDMARDIGATIVPDPGQAMTLHVRVRVDDIERVVQ